MAKTKVAKLTENTTVEEALQMVADKEVPQAAYIEWDADRIKRLAPSRNGGSDKTPDVTRKDFLANAKPITVTIDGNSFVLEPREFSTGSYGWGLNGKVTVKVGAVPTKVQVGVNLTVAHSKRDK